MDNNCYDLKLFKVRNSYFYVGYTLIKTHETFNHDTEWTKKILAGGMHVYNFVNNSIELLRKYVIAMYSHDFTLWDLVFYIQLIWFLVV